MPAPDDPTKPWQVPLVVIDITPTVARPRPRFKEALGLFAGPKSSRRDKTAELAAEIDLLAADANTNREAACQREAECSRHVDGAQGVADSLRSGSADRSDRRQAALDLRRRCGQARQAGRSSTQSAAQASRQAEKVVQLSDELTSLNKRSTPINGPVERAQASATSAASCAEAAIAHLSGVDELEELVAAILSEIEQQEKAEQIASLGPCDSDGNRTIELLSSVSPSSSNDRIQWFNDGAPLSAVIAPGTYRTVVAGDGQLHHIELKVVFPEGAEGDAVDVEFPACETSSSVSEIVSADTGRCDRSGRRPLRLISAISPEVPGAMVQWRIGGVEVGSAQSVGAYVTSIEADGQDHVLTLEVVEPSGIPITERVIRVERCEKEG